MKAILVSLIWAQTAVQVLLPIQQAKTSLLSERAGAERCSNAPNRDKQQGQTSNDLPLLFLATGFLGLFRRCFFAFGNVRRQYFRNDQIN